jgi:hypothetical protein
MKLEKCLNQDKDLILRANENEGISVRDHIIPGDFKILTQNNKLRELLLLGLNIRGNCYISRLNILQDASIAGMNVRRFVDAHGLTAENLYINKLVSGKNIYLHGLNIKENAIIEGLEAYQIGMGRLKVKNLNIKELSTSKLYMHTGKIIDKFKIENSEVKEFNYQGPIQTKNYSIKNSDVPQSLKKALKEGYQKRFF